MLYSVIGYFLIGYLIALLYYRKLSTMPKEKGNRAIAVFLIWPIIIVLSIAIIPFIEKKVSK
jgi:hypothetical protein